MTKKKKLILDTARKLFNEKGFHNVTIRMIAQEMQMSSGNLNYHFKKREDIFETMYFEMVTEFDERLNVLPDTDVSIAQIKIDISLSMKRMIDYSFFWTDMYNLINVSSKVKTHFQDVYKNRIEGSILLYNKLRQEKLMSEFSFIEEDALLAERMINYGNTWLYSSRLYSNRVSEKEIGYHVNTLLSMLFPYLTNKGKNEFKKILPSYF